MRPSFYVKIFSNYSISLQKMLKENRTKSLSPFAKTFKLLLSTQNGLNPLGPLRQQNDKVSLVGQINLTQIDIKIDHGYHGPNNLTQLGNKKIIQVVGKINVTHFIYVTLSNKNQLVPYDGSVDILFCIFKGLYWLQVLNAIHITLYK